MYFAPETSRKTHFHENRPHEKNVRHENTRQARAGFNYMS